MARIAWRFEDPTEATVEYMEINPNEDASPEYKKNLTLTRTSAGGVVLLFEGADDPVRFNFAGDILTQSQYEFLYNAWDKRHPVRITDDLDRTFTVYFESFMPKRKLSRSYPWRHTYNATTVVIDA